jgi:uncharacterized PurR-regulated membrane protein YhhQ (DUF165 family)
MKKELTIFDKPENVRKVLWVFYASLVIVVLVEFFIHKHPYFPWEEWPQFYAVYGFVAFVVLIFVAKYILRPLVKRREDYYD